MAGFSALLSLMAGCAQMAIRDRAGGNMATDDNEDRKGNASRNAHSYKHDQSTHSYKVFVADHGGDEFQSQAR